MRMLQQPLQTWRLALPVLSLALSHASLGAAQAPRSPSDEALQQARAVAEHGPQPEQGIASLRQLAAATPAVPGAARTLGLELYRTGKLVEAQKAFTQAEAEDPDDIEAIQLHGLTLYRLGQPAAAIPYLKRVRQWTPNANADAAHVLGLCYLNAGQYDAARESFAAEFGVDGESAGAYLLEGQELIHANLPELAAGAAAKALERNSNLPMAHFLLGEVFLFKSDLTRALADFEEERRLNPAYAPTYERLGDLYLRAGKADEAQQVLLKALSLDTSSTGPFLLMGKVLLRKGDPQSAVLYLQHGAKMDPSSTVAHTLLAQAYRAEGDELKAKQEAEVVSHLNAANQLKLTPVQ